MGMDISGKNPKSEVGEYVRFNVWSWRPMHALITIANEKRFGQLIPQETLDAMNFNDGAGLNTQEECDALADALGSLIERFLVQRTGQDGAGQRLCMSSASIGFQVKASPLLVDDSGRLHNASEIKGSKDDYRSPWTVDVEHVESFIAFLRACGGFSVC